MTQVPNSVGAKPRSNRTVRCAPQAVRIPSEETIADYAAVLKAISHPVRLKIMHILSESDGQTCACEIEAQFELSQPTISHHMRLLREAGLVDAEQVGQWVHYSVRRSAVASLVGHIVALID